MKASELVLALQQQIEAHGDRDVEFSCDHQVPPWYSCRPVEFVGTCQGMDSGRRIETILLQTSLEWTKDKIRRDTERKAELNCEIEEAKQEAERLFWPRIARACGFAKPSPKNPPSGPR